MKLWIERPERAEDADLGVGASVLGVVAVVEDEHPLGDEEADEADPDQQA